MPYNEEDYEGESGLLTAYTGEVIESWFQPNDRYGGLQLCLKQTTDNEATPEWTENFNCGAWQTLDGGETAENIQDPTKRRFNKSSRVQKLLDALTALGVRDVFKDRDASPREARAYVGLRLHWEEFSEGERTITDRETQETRKVNPSYNLPVQFLGTADGTSVAPTSTSTAAASTTSVLDGLSDDLVTALREARAASATHHEFVDKAVSLTGVAGNTTLVSAIADEDQLYKELS